MLQVAVLIDSTTVVPSTFVNRSDVVLLPIPIHSGGREYRDGVDLSDAEFLALLESSRERPTTAVPGIGEFASYFDRMLADGQVVVYPVATRKLSGLFNAAVQAAKHIGAHVVAVDPSSEDRDDVCSVFSDTDRWFSDLANLGSLDGRIVVVLNSALVSGATGLVAMGGLAGAVEGEPWTETVARMIRIKRSTGIFFTLSTLDYVVDRVGALRAFLGTLLRVRPILEIRDGLVAGVSRARTEAQAITLMVDLVRRRVRDAPLRVYFLHADAEESVAALSTASRSRLTVQEAYVGNCGATVARYTGRGGIGIAYCPMSASTEGTSTASTSSRD
jgi:fatty acid-binding protein DegV